jgi:hypothetical protein
VEECLSKFTGLELKNRISERKADLDSGKFLPKQPSLKNHGSQKENSMASNSITEEDIALMPLKSINNMPSRSKRYRDKKSMLPME